MLKEADRKQVEKLFAGIQHDVRVVFFTQETECQYCALTREILEEVTRLSPRLRLEVYDFVRDAERAKEYGIDKIPAIALVGDRDYGIRFYGIPAGYEFGTLIEGILDVGRRGHDLPEAVLRDVEKIDRPVHLQVMVSPTCPYCPRAVRTAHKLAMASPHVRADMVEVSEFPFLAVKYNVQGVPNTIINETTSLVGAQPEAATVRKILETIGK